jgi:hypothetical protein
MTVTSTRQHAFIIPFKIEPARTAQEQPVEVQLHVSTNQGATWDISSREKPDKGQFVFRAPHDGEYWYSLRTVDAQGVARPEAPLQPQLKVVVDTVAPRLELTATRGAAGEIVARWQAVDPHLKPASFKLEYQPGPAALWERVAVESPPSAMRHTSSGEATWWPKSGADTVTVRAEVTDAAGNPAINQALVKIGDIPPDSGPGPRDSRPILDGAPGAGSTQWPADRSTSEPLGHGSTSLSNASTPLAQSDREQRHVTPGDAASPSSTSSTVRPNTPTPLANSPSQPRNRPTRANPPAEARKARDPAAPSPLKFDLLPAGERPRMVNSRTFELEYEIDSVGPSGIAKVELWGTLNGGRTWSVYGVDPDHRSPVPVRVEGEGIYGFRIVVQSGSGLGAQPPGAGDLADVWIGVDLANPTGRITAAEVNDDGTEAVITWEAGDDVLDVRPIALEFSASPQVSASPQGPWTPIAAGLENSGSYTWRLDNRVPPVVYLRMNVRDEAGNVGVFDYSGPLSLDRHRPEGRIRSVRPLGQ